MWHFLFVQFSLIFSDMFSSILIKQMMLKWTISFPREIFVAYIFTQLWNPRYIGFDYQKINLNSAFATLSHCIRHVYSISPSGVNIIQISFFNFMHKRSWMHHGKTRLRSKLFQICHKKIVVSCTCRPID